MTDTPPSSTDRDAQIAALIDRVVFLEAGDIEEITDAGDKLVIHHVDGDRTRIRLSENEQLSVQSIVRYTTFMPTVTPADDVYATKKGTRIVHGPGRETRVRDSL